MISIVMMITVNNSTKNEIKSVFLSFLMVEFTPDDLCADCRRCVEKARMLKVIIIHEMIIAIVNWMKYRRRHCSYL